jgi:hypothetical protein
MFGDTMGGDTMARAAVSSGAADRVHNKPTTPVAQLKLWPLRVSSTRRTVNARSRPHLLLKKCLAQPLWIVSREACPRSALGLSPSLCVSIAK